MTDREIAKLDTEISVADLGASPAELDHNPEANREVSWIDHQGSPEMRMQERDNA